MTNLTRPDPKLSEKRHLVKKEESVRRLNLETVKFLPGAMAKSTDLAFIHWFLLDKVETAFPWPEQIWFFSET
jgi:hypothetical protein